MRQLDLRIGELFILGFENSRLEILDAFHDKFGLGGVILFARNAESLQSLKIIIQDIKARTSDDLIVAVDQEGGSVCRITGADFPTFPSPAYYSGNNDLRGATHAARVTSEHLLDIGVNMNLCPVADVLTNPDNLLMKSRCFSGDIHRVCEFVRSVVRVQNRSGVASCVKHFPGLGNSAIDPHVKLAMSYRSHDFYSEYMFPPFKAAFDESCPAVMTTHIKATLLDPENPATFSGSIISDILRSELGFDGVIITDDLDMGAVESIEDAVPRAISAGHDMVLICHSLDRQLSCAKALQRRIAEDDVLSSQVAASIERVRRLKEKFKV